MPKIAANLSMLFTEVPFLDRFERAAKAGFTAVEFLFPYAFGAADIKQRLDAHGLTLVLHNLPAGDWDAGERGIACHPDRVEEFRAGVATAITYARALGVDQLNCLAGKAPAGLPEDVLRATFVENLRYAAAELKKASLRLLIEPINTFDIPGFYLNHTTQAVSIRWKSGPTMRMSSTTSIMPSAWKANWPQRCKSTCRASVMSSWPTTLAATNPARAKSTTRFCSPTWTASAMPAGSAANTSPPRLPKPDSAGASNS
jgi:hypothetical protein